MNSVLVVEISGKRPGGVEKRPTEKFECNYDHLIISNNSEGYETTWDIVNVPQEYVSWYKESVATSDNAWYAPMNRSYAIKYAKEHGYKYLVQLDDNIKFLEIGYLADDAKNRRKRFRVQNRQNMLDDFIEMLCCILENTNAGIAGCNLASSNPDAEFLSERYCYSIFALKLDVVPDLYAGDFEDDIEFRLKCTQMGIPSVMVVPLRYSKTAQRSGKDETGNRAAYTATGLKRGDTMRAIHGEYYSCGYAKRTMTTQNIENGKVFRHKLQRIKLGVVVKDKDAIEKCFQSLLNKWAKPQTNKVIVKRKKKHV